MYGNGWNGHDVREGVTYFRGRSEAGEGQGVLMSMLTSARAACEVVKVMDSW